LDNPSQRNSPLITPASVALSVLVLCILGGALWLGGGLIFNPGPVSAKEAAGVVLAGFHSHMEFESQCRYCHAPFQDDQAAQCLDCHKEISTQLEQGDGLHGRLDKPRACAACHQEHKGREFDPSQAALVSFDHSLTSFPLTGKHGTLTCERCHSSDAFSAAKTDCASCHNEPQSHAGMFGTDCAACHTAFDWRPAKINDVSFDHRFAKFTLDRHTADYNQAPLLCTACHTGQKLTFDPQPCQNCHGSHDAAFMNNHIKQYGTDCLVCHDGVDRLHGFDHQVVFPLNGKHADVKCADCHQNNQFRGTSPSCATCHKEPAIHAGFFGTRCDYCHTSQAWRPAPLRAHTFPLDHGGNGKEIACQTCHPATYSQYPCEACHEHAPETIAKSHASLNLPPDQLANCLHCHLDGKVTK